MHYWPEAPDTVMFLRSPHRHEFHVEVELPVEHDDRDVEFILLKGIAWNILRSWHGWADPLQHAALLDFGTNSCEMIARYLAVRLIKHYGVTWAQVTVSEDGENGARVLEIR
jgi:hypothetical protein